MKDKKGNSYKKLIHFCIFIVVIVVLAKILTPTFKWYFPIYNNMTTNQQKVKYQEGQVQNVLQRRNDVIEELVGTVKDSQRQEKSVYGKIAEARTEYYHARNNYKGSKSIASRAQDLSDQGHSLNIMVGSIHEAYPHLRSNGTVNRLMSQVEKTNSSVVHGRKNLNSSIFTYDNQLVRFPNNIVAIISGHHTVHYFKADKGATKAPNTDTEKD